MQQDPALETFCAFFNKLDKTSTKNLSKVYTSDVIFTDPVHRLEGRQALEAYLAELYANVEECRFHFHECQRVGPDAFVTWTMRLRHPRLARGAPIEVEGCSKLRFDDDGRVCLHRDYFDVGALLYEHLPLLGRLIGSIKSRLGR